MTTSSKATFVVMVNGEQHEIPGTRMEEVAGENRVRIFDGDEQVASFVGVTGVFKKA